MILSAENQIRFFQFSSVRAVVFVTRHMPPKLGLNANLKQIRQTCVFIVWSQPEAHSEQSSFVYLVPFTSQN